jgi:two-component system heavy metal sensor histidine kinase CusS
MTKRLSLTTRLSLFYTLASAVVLAGLGWVTSAAMNRHFEDLDRALLEDKIHLIQELGGPAPSIIELQESLSGILHVHERLYVVLHRQGVPVYASSNLKIPYPTTLVLGDDPKTQTILRWKSNGHDYRALGAKISSDSTQSEPLAVWVALDTEHHSHFQRQFQAILLSYIVVATMFSGLLGWFGAHRGLAQLRIMKSRAQTVTSNKMGERMPVASVPIEMADLATTLNDMLDRLQEDFRRLSEFSSDLAHELRTPISNLLTETQVTLSMARTAEVYQDVLASNSEELQRLGRMVADMLYLAKTENGLALPSRELIDIATEVQALFEFYEALAQEKGLTLVLEGQCRIQGDRLMLRRALSNLLSNAMRHATPLSDVLIQLQAGEEGTLVKVINQGDDIHPDMLPRLFDRFFRVEKSRAHPNSDGAGLGLPITRAITQAHGGTITVTSQAGQTCFTLWFPKYPIQ